MELDALRFRVPFDALDLATVDEFLRWARDRLACAPAGASTRVVLDLVAVEFVMAAGIQALLDLDRELQVAGRTLAVANAAPIVARVLEICGVADRWAVE